MQKWNDIEKNGKEKNDMQQAIDLYVMVITAALPFAIVFAVGDLIMSTLFTSAFSGKLLIK